MTVRIARSWWSILLLSLLWLPLLAHPARAKSWSIPQAEIALRLAPDGSLAVTEQRTFRFSGAFSHIYQDIRFPARSTLTDLTVRGPEGSYSQAATGAPATLRSPPSPSPIVSTRPSACTQTAPSYTGR